MTAQLPADAIGRDHPAFGTRGACYLFERWTSARRDFVLVMADSAWTIQVLERIILVNDRVSETCRHVLTARGDASLEFLPGSIRVMRHVEFIATIVAADRWLGDGVTIHAFQRSLTDEDRELAHRLFRS